MASVPCKCRDCMKAATAANLNTAAFCLECEEAECEENKDCLCPDAYGAEVSESPSPFVH